MNSAMVAGLLLAFMVVSAVRRRRERLEWSRLADAQRAGFGRVMEELTSLRSALLAAGATERPPRLPAPPLPSVKRDVVSVTRDDDPIHTRATVEAPPPSDEVDAALRRAFHLEADERDARHAAREAQPPPPPSGSAALTRFQGPAPGEDDATVQRTPALPRANLDDGERTTDEELTRVHTRDTTTQRPPPHAPPRPVRGVRPTLLGLAGAALERPTSDPKRAAREHATRKRDRDTLTPTEPSAPSLDARIQRRWSELVAAAQQAGEEAAHCHGLVCTREGGGIDRCACACDGCVLVVDLLVRSQREIRGSE